ncbi:MAG TPA: PD-(D/E)XK nuclease family protein, partial [Candidatus Eremiobacteraceae bacterium]|nr:PD-(D/E)XK nuclease family protein [Candidatus Eremiobacteraceae bacterium]
MGAGTAQPSGDRGRRAVIDLKHHAGIRACLHAALAGVNAQNQTLALPRSQLGRAILLDDLCLLFERCAARDVDDATLACAAAEAAPAWAMLAATLYAARSLARAAGMDERRTKSREQLAGSHSENTIVPTFAAGLEQAAQWGARVLAAPRGIVSALMHEGEDRLTPAVLRLLRAAFGDAAAVSAALTGFPYSVDPLELRQALVALAADARVSDVKTLATTLKAGWGRDAALAAATAIESIRQLRQSKKFTLLAAVDRLAEAIATTLATSQPSEEYAHDLAQLRDAAREADAVWSRAKHPVPARTRVEVFSDGLLSAMVESGIVLVPAGCVAAAQVDAVIACADVDAHPLPGDLFEHILGESSGSSGVAAENGRSAEPARIMVLQSVPEAIAAAALRSLPPARWTRPVPEVPSPVVASGMTFSASRLNAFVKCSRRWFYEYLCAAIEEPASMQAAYGRVLHAALEALHRDIRRPHEHSAGEMLQRLVRELDVAFGRSRGDFSSQLEYEVCRQRARRVAEQYVRWLEQESKRAPLEIVDVELSHRFSRGGHQFVGYIDRIDRPAQGGPITIFDYKTGRIDDDPHAYLEKVRRGDEAQLALYFAMRSGSGDDVARIALVSLRDPRDEVWILALDIVPEQEAALV